MAASKSFDNNNNNNDDSIDLREPELICMICKELFAHVSKKIDKISSLEMHKAITRLQPGTFCNTHRN